MISHLRGLNREGLPSLDTQGDGNPPLPLPSGGATKGATHPGAAGTPADAVHAWLSMLTKVLRLPEGEAAGIRDELEAHLRERVRDLMISGCDEAEATRRAIGELGEAAGLAQSYRSARRFGTRRLAMNMAILGVAGSAALLSMVAILRPAGPVLSAVYEAQPAAEVAALEQVRVDANFDSATLKDVLEFIAQKSGRQAHVYWGKLESADLQRDTSVTVRARGATLPALLGLVNEAVDAKGARAIELGMVEGMLGIAPREFFDRRTRSLASYDLSGIIAARQATYQEKRDDVIEGVVRVVTDFVSAEDWVDNGGELARQTVVGDRMFVEAPQRFHPQIQWILGQLPAAGAGCGGSGNAKRVPVLGDVPLIGEVFRTGVGDGEMTTRIYQLKHISAPEVKAALELCCPGIRVSIDPATNAVVVAMPNGDDRADSAIKALDVPADRRPAAPAAPAQTQVVYVSGRVWHPGAFAMPDKEFTVRRLIVAAGGLEEGASEVVVTRSRDGKARELYRMSRAALIDGAGDDPVLAAGDLVSVK
jgi:hypothetical protein